MTNWKNRPAPRTARFGRRPRDTRRRGIATLWLVLSIIVLMSFVVLTVDVLYAVRVGRQLGAGADAAALAGAIEVRRSHSLARDRAVALAAANAAGQDPIVINRNDANAPAGHVVVGYYDRTERTFSTTPPTGLSANAVHVDAPRVAGSPGGPMPTVAASFLGINAYDITRGATAMVRGDVGPAVIALNTTASCSLDLRGTSAGLQVLGGAIVVDSSHSSAACHSGRPGITAEELHVVGGTDGGFESQVDLTGELITGSDFVPDPLAALPTPPQPANAPPSTRQGNTTIYSPGTYNNLSINNGNHVFQPGLYYFTGLFRFNGGTIDGTAGVTLFFGGPNGRLDAAGNGTLRLVGLTPSQLGLSTPADIADIQIPIYQQRGNTRDMEINGNGNWLIDGTIYAPSGTLLLRGTPGNFANGLIADQIEQRGNNDLVIDYEDQFPRIPRKVFLVE